MIPAKESMQRTSRLVMKQVTATSFEPVTLAEAKSHMRVDIADDDTLIASLITGARDHVESLTCRQIMPATWRLSLDVFPSSYHRVGAWYRQTAEGTDIILPRPTLQSITHIKYTDTDGVVQTLSTDVYAAQTDEEPGRVTLKYGQQWPDTIDIPNAVVVTYAAGYSTSLDEATAQAAVPRSLKQAILMLASHWYENREATGQMSDEVAFAVNALCQPHRCTEVW